MTKGFGSKNCQSADEIISNLRQNRKLLRNNFTQKRDAFKSGWLAQYQNNQYEKSPEYSLYKPYSEHSCLIAEKPSKHSTVGHHNEKLLFFANTDFWSVLVKQYNLKNKLLLEYSYNGELLPKQRKRIEFQFSVKVGPNPFFIPTLIKQRICSWYGADAYSTWRELVKADLPNLMPYLTAYNPPENLHSIVSEDSSARVCQSVGLPVQHGVAYWLKQKKADFHPQVLADVVEGTSVCGLSYPTHYSQLSYPNLSFMDYFNNAFNTTFKKLLQVN
jgi:hypothetical protein